MKNGVLWKWLHGLLGAIVTGASNGVLLVVANEAFDIFKDARGLVVAVTTSTLVSTCSYLKQSPLPYYLFEGGDVPIVPPKE